jgi:hypothetical protein
MLARIASSSTRSAGTHPLITSSVEVALYALLVLMAVTPCRGFELWDLNSDGKPYNLRWPAEAMPIRFLANADSLTLLSPPSADQSLAAIQAALQSWSVPPVRLRLDGTVATRDAGQDGINLITVADTPTNRDAVGDLAAWSAIWTVQRGDRLYLTEADLVLNPKYRFTTDGAPGAYDIQESLSPALGFALGLRPSPIAADSMFPLVFAGQTYRRSLEPDDVAGLHALYGGAPSSPVGAIAGCVLTQEGEPVFGAHVVATDAQGIVRVGAQSDWNGDYVLPSLPAGNYQVYAEPEDGPLPALSRDARRDFRTAFAEGPAVVPVVAGDTTSLAPIQVEAEAPTLNPWLITTSQDGQSFRGLIAQAVQIKPGSQAFVVVGGEGLNGVPRTGFSVSGSDISLDVNGIRRGIIANGLPYVSLPLSVRPGAPPGARNLYVATATEQAAFTGCIDVVDEGP